MSSSNRVSLAWQKEVTFGVSPGTQLTEMRFSSESLVQNPTIARSTTIRPDRETASVFRNMIDPGGAINFNLDYGEYDEMFAGMAMDDWASPLAISGSISAVASSNDFTSSALFAGIVPGQWIKVAGFTNPANNGYFKVTVVTSTSSITVAGATLVDETASATISGSVLFFPGLVPRSYSIEAAYLDTALWDYFLGMRVGQFTLNLAAATPVDGSFTFLGATAAETDTATIGTGTNVVPGQNPEMTAQDNVVGVYVNGDVSLLDISALNLTGNNHLLAKRKLGQLPSFDIGIESFELTGTLTAYFEDRVLLNYARSFTPIGIAVILVDANGAAYALDIPNAVVSGGDPVDTGQDTDIIPQLNFQAKYDSVSGKMMSITRFDA